MNIIKRSILLLSVVCFSVFSEAPVVDQSASFAAGAVDSPQIAAADQDIDLDPEDEVIKDQPQRAAASNDEVEKLQVLYGKMAELQRALTKLQSTVDEQSQQLKTLQSQLAQAEQESQQTVHHSDKQKGAHKKISASKNSDPMDEQLSYVAAYELIKVQKYPEAKEALKSYLQRYNDGPYSANAHYWLGELYVNEGKHQQALNEFKIIASEFADSNKYPAAEYKLGVVYEKLGDHLKARAQYQKVSTDFPGTSLARLALGKLAK